MNESSEVVPQEGSRGKVMGILSIVLAGISIFIPVIGVYLTVVSAILAALSYGKSALLGYIAIGVNFLSLFFLSPLLWVAASAENADENSIAGLVWFLLAAQVLSLVFLIWKSKKKVNA